MNRDPALQSFLSAAFDALAGCRPEAAAEEALERISAAVALVTSSNGQKPQRLPACSHLPDALGRLRCHSAALAPLGDMFAALEPLLYWSPRRASGANASATWPNGHANALIVGPGGLESRHDVQIGATLLAPQVRYPDHSHPPEEVYLVLSPGRFRHGGSGWFEPGIGGTLYNEPDIDHAMASGDAPLFALWFLWTGHPA